MFVANIIIQKIVDIELNEVKEKNLNETYKIFKI